MVALVYVTVGSFFLLVIISVSYVLKNCQFQNISKHYDDINDLVLYSFAGCGVITASVNAFYYVLNGKVYPGYPEENLRTLVAVGGLIILLWFFPRYHRRLKQIKSKQ